MLANVDILEISKDNVMCNWQLAVVDHERTRELRALKKESDIHDGEIVHIASVYPDYNSTIKGIEFNNTVLIAQAWSSQLNRYLVIPLSALHPICTEKDAIEMENKFGISLEGLW